MRGIWQVVVLVLALGSISATTGKASPADPTNQHNLETLRNSLQEGKSRFDNGDYQGAKARLDTVVADPLFAWLTTDEQLDAKAGLGAADYELSDFAAALPYIKEVSVADRANGEAWVLRTICDNRVEDYDDAAFSLTTIAQRWPQSLSELSDASIYMAARRHLSETRRADLLEALYAVKWSPQDPFDDDDIILYRLVQVRLAKGDVAGAAEVAAGIRDAGLLAHMRIDNRFADVVKANPGHYDIAAAAAQNIDMLRTKSQAVPDKLKGIDDLVYLMLVAGRPTDALQVLDGALARNKIDRTAFSDADQINWTENYRAIALVRLGRTGESLAELASAAQLTEDGNSNISQAINLADAYDDAGRPRDALTAVASVGPDGVSAYGRMQLEEVRVCAYAQLNDDADIKKSVDYLTSHAPDSAQDAGRGLLCANDMDDAAKVFIAALDDPDTSNQTLFALQDFLDDPAPSGFAKVEKDRLAALKTRPDLAAAIAKYGHIEKIPLDPTF